VVSNGCWKKKSKKKKREITTQREQRYLLENIFYKNIRENTTNTNLPRNWIVSVTVVKNRALESFIFFSFFFFGDRWIAKSPRVIFGPRRESLGCCISIPDRSFFPVVLLRSSISIMSIRLIILESGLDCNSACQRQFFPSKFQLWRRGRAHQYDAINPPQNEFATVRPATQDNWFGISSWCFYSGCALFSFLVHRE